MFDSHSKTWGEKSRLYLISLFLVSFLCYFPSLKIGYLWDDKGSVETNPYLQHVDVKTFFTNPEASFPNGNKEIYRPLRTLYLALILHFFNSSPMTFHAFNILLHLFVCLLAYCYIRTRFSNRLAVISAFIFAVHPVHSESINLIIGSADLLCAFFILFALLANQLPSNRKWIYTACFLILALFSKESGIIGLPLLLLDDFWKKQKTGKEILLNFQSAIYLAISSIYLVIRFSVTGRMTQLSHHGENIIHHVDFALQGFLTYLKLLVWPFGFKLDYIFFPGPFYWTLFLFLLVLTGLYWIAKRNSPMGIFKFSLLWFLICYLPISNIIPIKTIVSERLMYLPSLGFCIFLAGFLEKVIKRINLWGWGLFIFFLGISVFSTFARNSEWLNEDEFWRLNLQRSPYSARANANYAVRMILKKDYQSARQLFEKAVAYNPNETAFIKGLEWVKQVQTGNNTNGGK